jgi:Zn-dependent protease with chaperone function
VIAAILLVAYAGGMGTFGARLLRRAKWPARAPLLGTATYLAAEWSVLTALGLVGLTLAVHATALGGGLSNLIGACVRRLQNLYLAPGGTAFASLGLALASAVAARIAFAAVSHLRAVGRQALQHAETARLAGRLEPSLGAIVVDHPQPAAYCVAGRCPAVIVTTGAVEALDAGQLDGVLAHERAHLASRHHRLTAAARIGRQVMPFLPLHRDAETQVARLVEMHADDAASQVADPQTMARAMVVLATPSAATPSSATPSSATPAPALAAAATDALQRIHRLLGPVEPLSRLRRHLLRAAVGALLLAPAVVALAPAVAALALGRVPAP